jgi:peptidoglycan/LPS O-acetylase OafA/YrhL
VNQGTAGHNSRGSSGHDNCASTYTCSQVLLMTDAHQLPPQTPSFPPRGGEYLPILDGWRAAAILLVLLYHGLLHTDIAGRTYLAGPAYLIGRMGALGVLVFFCISGYQITAKLLSESEVSGAFSIHAFYIKRIFRILPLVAAYLIVLVILSAAGVIKLATGDWSAPLFLRNYWPGSWYTAHFWSLSVEEHFYLFWPVCILVSGWRRAMWIGLFIIAIVGVGRPWELQHVMNQARALQHTEMRLDYIMMGCVAALAMNFHPIVARRARALGSPLGLTALFLALVFSTLPTALRHEIDSGCDHHATGLQFRRRELPAFKTLACQPCHALYRTNFV